MKKNNQKLTKTECRSVLVNIICIAAAAVLMPGIFTIGAMNLMCTDELYTTYATDFSRVSVICGIAVLAVTVSAIAVLYAMMKSRSAAAAVLALALLARLAAALFWKIEPESDFAITYELSKLIADTPVREWGRTLDAYGTSYNDLWAVHMPFVVYQSLLLKLTDSAFVLRLANAFFSFGSCFFIVKLAHTLGGEKAARAALAFTAFNPTVIFFVPVLTNQHASQFFFVLALWVFMGGGIKNDYVRAWLAGLCAGVSQLLRPEIIVAVVAAAAYTAYSCIRSGSAAKKLTVFAAGLCVFLAVIAAMNTFLISADAVHRNIYSGNLNYKIMVGLNPDTNGSWCASDAALEGNNEAINTVIKSRLSQNPLRLIPRLYGKSVYQLGSYVYTWSYRSDCEWISQMIMRRGGTALMLVVCAAAAWNMLFRRREDFIWLYMTTAVFAAVYAVIEVQSRYNFVMLPVLILLASAGNKRNFSEK